MTVRETSTSPGPATDPTRGADVDGNTAEILPDEFALAGMEAGAHLDLKAAHRITSRAGAADGARRAIEGGQETVAECLTSRPRAARAHGA